MSKLGSLKFLPFKYTWANPLYTIEWDTNN